MSSQNEANQEQQETIESLAIKVRKLQEWKRRQGFLDIFACCFLAILSVLTLVYLWFLFFSV